MQPIGEPGTDAQSNARTYFDSDRHSDADAHSDTGADFNSDAYSDTDPRSNSESYFITNGHSGTNAPGTAINPIDNDRAWRGQYVQS